MSADIGLVALETFPKALDQHRFIEFVKKIRQAYRGKRFGLFLDNATIHRSKA